jgi:hypothetical protein
VTEVERAVEYIGIFIGLGDDWPSCAPVDGKRTKRGIRISGIEIGPDTDQPGVWWLDDGVNPIRRYCKKETAA